MGAELGAVVAPSERSCWPGYEGSSSVPTLVRETLVTAGVRLYGLAVGIAILAVSARWLGPEAFGRVAAIGSVVALCAVLCHLSLGQVVIHHAAERRSAVWLQEAISAIAVVTAAMTLGGWSIAAGLCWSGVVETFRSLGAMPLVLGFAGLPALIWDQNSGYLLMAAGRVLAFNCAQFLVASVNLLALFLFVWGLGFGVDGAVAAALLAQLSGATTTMASLVHVSGKLARPTLPSVRRLLSSGFKLHVNAVATFAISGLDILIVQWFRGNEETGLYSAAVQLAAALFILPDSAGLLLYSATAQLGADRAWSQTKRMLAILLGVMTTLTVLAAVSAPMLLTFFAGDRFEAAAPVFQILLLGSVGRTASAILAPQWIGRGLFWQASGITLAAGVLNVAAALVLVPRFGMTGAAWVFVITYGVGIVSSAWFGIWIERRLRAA